MNVRSLPDLAVILGAWILTACVVAAAIADPQRSFVRTPMFWFLPFLAIAWTAGFVGTQRLKKKHEQEFKRLGCPQLFRPPHEPRYWQFFFYVFGFRFLRLSDRVVTTGFSILVALTVAAGSLLVWAWTKA